MLAPDQAPRPEATAASVWDATTSGGEHLAAYAIFRTPTEGATVVVVDKFVREWCEASKAGSPLPTSLFELPGRGA